MALSFDLDEASFGFDENCPDPRLLLEKRGLI
jgi:hypothetical protein